VRLPAAIATQLGPRGPWALHPRFHSLHIPLQFFLTTVECGWLDGKHVVFGKVLEGMDIVMKMEAMGDRSGRPSQPLTILDSGELAL